MMDEEGAIPPSKKRAAGREISRDNPGLDDDDSDPGDMGTFKRATDEVLASRRIVKVRRQQTKPASSSNPFAGLQLVAPSKLHEGNAGHTNTAAETPVDEHGGISQTNEANEDEMNGRVTILDDVEAPIQTEENKIETDVPSHSVVEGDNDTLTQVDADKAALDVDHVVNEQEREREGSEETEEIKKDSENEKEAENSEEQTVDEEIKASQDTTEKETTEKPLDQPKDTAEISGPFSSFQQLSSRQNAFTGLAGTGFSTASFSFGFLSKEGPGFTSGSSSLFGQSGENPPNSSKGFGASNDGGSLQIFGSAVSEEASVGGGNKPIMQQVLVETGEENEKAVFNAGAILFEYLDGGWKERGKGEVKVNVSASGSEKARLVMRARGNYRLILNANLYPDMSLKSMERKGVTFACINSATDGRDVLATFALKFKEASILDDFRCVVEKYKGKKDDTSKAAESLKTSGD